MPRPAREYAELLMKRIEDFGSQVYLVNTGWSGGRCGSGGERMPLDLTRRCVRAIVAGEVDRAPSIADPIFNLQVPVALEGVPAELLWPRKAWACGEDYDRAAEELAGLFGQNYRRFLHPDVADYRDGGP